MYVIYLSVPQLGDNIVLPPTIAWSTTKPSTQPDSLKELTELEKELTLSDSKKQKHKKCKFSKTFTHTTFHGGLKAGNFTNKGTVTSMDVCKAMCCTDIKCDVAVMMRNACFLLTCKSKELCKPRKAHLEHFALRLAYRDRKAEEKEEGKLKVKHNEREATEGENKELFLYFTANNTPSLVYKDPYTHFCICFIYHVYLRL